MKQDLFADKSLELEQAYHKFQSCLNLYRTADHDQIQNYIQQLMTECRKNADLLDISIQTGRSPAITALSEAQLAYYNKINDIMLHKITGYVHSEDSSKEQDQAEAAALYAEYAIDFAVQSLNQALIAALFAIDNLLKEESK